MATSGENISAGMTTESGNDKVDTCLINSGLSSQHQIFANAVKNRGGFIQPQETTISKSSCNKCAARRSSSLTDLRSLSASSISARHQEDNFNHHDDHPPCASCRGRTSRRSSISKQHSGNEPKPPTSARRPPKTVLPSPFEQQPVIPFPPPVTTRRDKSKSGIPVRAQRATSSSTSSLIDNRVTSDNKTSKIPRSINTHSSSSSKHSGVIDNNTDELLKRG